MVSITVQGTAEDVKRELLELLGATSGNAQFTATPPKARAKKEEVAPAAETASPTVTPAFATAPAPAATPAPAAAKDSVQTKITSEVIAKLGVTVAKELLTKFGVARAKELKESQIEAYVTEAKALIAAA